VESHQQGLQEVVRGRPQQAAHHHAQQLGEQSM
jgi:hypothetical protein